MRKPLREAFQSLSESVRPVLGLMDGIRKQAPEALRNSSIRAQHTALQCASVVILSGYLESFMRDSAKSFFKEIQRSGKGMAELDEKFKHIHFTQGSRLFQDIASREKEGSPFADASAFLRRLAAPMMDGTAPPVWEAFARTEANPSPRVIKAYLTNFGIQDGMRAVSDSIGNIYSMQALETSLNAFIAVRNECAHTGIAKSVPTSSDIEGYVHLLRTLALGIAKVLNKRIEVIVA